MDTLNQRFWAKVDRRGDDECWPWLASCVPAGYGKIFTTGTTVRAAHIVSFILANGREPSGTLDHTCHDPATCAGGRGCTHRKCVNPRHLTEVAPSENNARGRVSKRWNTVCSRGHDITDPANVRVNQRTGGRQCRLCALASNRAQYAAKRGGKVRSWGPYKREEEA